jgi:hypothetical protein
MIRLILMYIILINDSVAQGALTQERQSTRQDLRHSHQYQNQSLASQQSNHHHHHNNNCSSSSSSNDNENAKEESEEGKMTRQRLATSMSSDVEVRVISRGIYIYIYVTSIMEDVLFCIIDTNRVLRCLRILISKIDFFWTLCVCASVW